MAYNLSQVLANKHIDIYKVMTQNIPLLMVRNPLLYICLFAVSTKT